MATTSNAFNFSSFMQSSVDPRTGLYTQTIALPPLNANDLCGPDIPMQLNFNPMNSKNAGFGIGWSLKLSSYNHVTGMLELHTGETFKVSDNGPGERPVIDERKLESFHFHNISKNGRTRFRIAHKSGLSEILEPQSKDPDVAVTVRVTNASGHGVTVKYNTDAEQPRLALITDDSRRKLLEFNYSLSDRVSMTSNPGTRASARYTLMLESEKLIKITLPSAADEYWDLRYQAHVQGSGNDEVTLQFLDRIKNPDGGVEQITYKSDGHRYPGINRTLPCVEKHVVMPDPLDASTHITTHYRFSSNNFLGNNTDLIYGDDGTDQLYRYAGSNYAYTSTAEHYLGSSILRTVVSTFNRFHLMTEQSTTEQGCIETITTKYHEIENKLFKDQPEYFQLPHIVTKRWRMNGSLEPGDHEQTITTYDLFGNLLTEHKPDGSRMERKYYPGSSDPEGFVRNLESATLYPAETDDPQAPKAQIVSNLYQYIELPAIPQTNIDPSLPELPDLPNWLALEQEDMFEGTVNSGTLLNRKTRHYLNKTDTPFLHGRLDEQTLLINDSESRSSWKYEKVKDDEGLLNWSQSTETFTDHTHTLQKKTASTHDLHTGQLALEQDTNGVYTRYRYDLLGRVIEQTVSPGSPFATTRTTVYKLLEDEGKRRACEETTDSKGVVTRIVYDGSRRPIREKRTAKHPVSGKVITRTVAELRYDSAGRLTSETSFDYLPAKDSSQDDRELKLESRYAYDGWQQRCEVLRPDGVKERVEASPLEAGGQLITQWIESPDVPGRQQLTISKLNRFGKPVYEYRQVEAPGKPAAQVGRTDYTYDGLGRCLSETKTIRDPDDSSQVITRTSEFRYDALSRMVSNQRPNGSILIRAFASHSLGELVTLLRLKVSASAPEQLLYERAFDGLGRLTRLVVGTRKERYTYRGTTQLVETRTVFRTAFREDTTGKGKRKRVIHYDYQPELTEQPKMLTATVEEDGSLLSTVDAKFDYDANTADINEASNSLGTRKYAYTDQGDLAEEHWLEPGGTPYSTFYQQSWQGLPLQRKHSDGQPCDYDYDDLGRICSVIQGPLKSTLTYNDIGLLKSTETRDTTNPDPSKQPVTLCSQEYDALGRETSRTLSANGKAQTFTQVWLDNDMLHSRTLERDGQHVRKETFEYDTLGRLTKYDCPDATAEGVANERLIKTQLFSFDDVDNIKRCRTTFADGQRNDATFTYASDDLYRLDKVKHSLPPAGCPAEQSFDYDELGNMLNDECGNKLYYDSFGRLHQVLDGTGKIKAQYGYDGHDQLIYSGTDSDKRQRRYLGYSLDCMLEDGLLTHYLHTAGEPRAEYQVDVARQDAAGPTTLLLTDHAGSVVSECTEQATRHACYTPYGEQLPEDSAQQLRSLLAFNGEAREYALGWYLLGSGYRAYNPCLMRFHSPDSLPPEASGINPYVYALGNPVYWRDPTGHRSQAVTRGREAPVERIIEDKPKVPWYAWIGVVAAAAIFVASAIAMPWTAPATIGLTASYVVGVVGVAANGVATVMQGVATAMAYEKPELSNAFFHVSTAFSVLGMFAGGYGAAATKAAVRGARAGQNAASNATGNITNNITNNITKNITNNITNNFGDLTMNITGAKGLKQLRDPVRKLSNLSKPKTTTSATPSPSGSATPGLVMDGERPSTSAALRAKQAAIMTQSTKKTPASGAFRLDLATLGEGNSNVLHKAENGSFFTAPRT